MGWIKKLKVKGLKMELLDPQKGKTALLYVEVEASVKSSKDTMLFYGHFDK